MDEIELKFAVPAQARAALEAALKRGRVRTERMRAVYYDTQDDALARHAVSIRLRQEGKRWMQTAKTSTPNSLCRSEHNVLVVGQGADQPVLDLALHDAQPVGRALRLALTDGGYPVANMALTERFRTDVRRLSRTVRIRGSKVELSFDVGNILAGNRAAVVREFELELKVGSMADLIELAKRWAARHGLSLSTLSKAERGVRLAHGASHGPPVTANRVEVRTPLNGRTFMCATIENCLSQVLANASEVDAGADDEEYVHQLRIGLRRLRTALRELGTACREIEPACESLLRSAFHELGLHRDGAVVVPAVRASLARAGCDGENPGSKPSARLPADVLRDPLFQWTMLNLIALVNRPIDPAGKKIIRKRALRSIIVKKLSGLHRSLTRDAQQFRKLDSSRQHRVRKRLKRMRYLSEFAMPLFGTKKVSRYLANWKEAQDALGEAVDLRTAYRALRAQSSQQGGLNFPNAWFEEHRRSAVARCRRALLQAVKKATFWTA